MGIESRIIEDFAADVRGSQALPLHYPLSIVDGVILDFEGDDVPLCHRSRPPEEATWIEVGLVGVPPKQPSSDLY